MGLVEELVEFKTKSKFDSIDLLSYRQLVKNKRRSLRKEVRQNLYKAEYHFVSYLLSRQAKQGKVKRCLKKTVRNIKKLEETEGSNLLAAYYQSFLDYEKERNPESFLQVVGVMQAQQPLLFHVYQVCELTEEELVSKRLKTNIEYRWNDLDLNFSSDEDKQMFLSGERKDYVIYFNDKLADNILQLTLYIDHFCKQAPKTTRIFALKKWRSRFQTLFEKAEQLRVFMEENFIVSEHLNDLVSQASAMNTFFCSLEETILSLDKEKVFFVCGFKAPPAFSGCESLIALLVAYFDKKCKRTLTKRVEVELEEYFDLQEPTMKMPFLPVFYDIAFDYIDYPREESASESSFSKVFEKFSFFRKK